MKTIRTFIAINFDDAVKLYLRSAQAKIKTISRNGNFTREENLHLTLVFLGEISFAQIEQVKQAMEAITTQSFELTLSKIGRFKRQDGDIVWVGVVQNQMLNSIFNELFSYLKAAEFKLESRVYKPHLTIARKVVFNEGLGSLPTDDIKTKIDHVSLMKSENLSGKLTYTEIHKKILS